jgi:aminopeptidase N
MPIERRVHARCGCGEAHEAAAERAQGRPFPFAHSPRNFERDRPFRVIHLAADLVLDVPKKAIRATATLDIERTGEGADELVLDAVGFVLGAVEVDGRSAPHAYDGQRLRVRIPKSKKSARVSVAYAATPRRGMYFLAPDEHVPSRPTQVWTQCQEQDARHWVPCHDEPHMKQTSELVVTAPSGWSVLSNGELVDAHRPKGKPWRFHWKMTQPHASYLLTLVAGAFAVIEDEAHASSERGAKRVPLSYWVPEGKEKEGKRTFARTPDMVRLFGDKTGVPYPWNKYAQVVVHDFIFGGMENTTATTLYEHVLLDDRATLDVTSDDLIAHELAHQWFGDYVTCRDWSEGWLNEGFATYFEHVWREHDLGRDEHEYALAADLHTYTSESHGRYRRPIVCRDFDAPLDLFDRHLYEKGGLVLHALRVELGDEAFWRGVRLYLARVGGGVAETRDLERALEDASGRSLGKHFEQWVHKPGHPELEVTLGHDRGVLSVDVKQVQVAADGVPQAFDVPLVLHIVDAKGRVRRERLDVGQRAMALAIPCAERPRFVVVDPDMAIVGEVRVKAPLDMLRAQLAAAPTARGRWLAAEALSKNDDPDTLAALAARLADEREFWGVRADCATALGRIKAKECEAILGKHVKTKHPKVRRAVCAALGRFRTEDAFRWLKARAVGDESYMVAAEAARALGKTRQAGALDVLVDVVDRPSWSDVIAVGALDGMANLRDDKALPHVLGRMRYGHPTRARRAAIMALPKLAQDRKTREALEELLDDADPSLRVDVVRALGELGDAKSRGPLRSRLDIDLDPRVRRRIREVLRDLGGEGKKAVAELREELEKLATEHAELKARLARLEARLASKKKK